MRTGCTTRIYAWNMMRWQLELYYNAINCETPCINQD
jgi:hypothetical protein